jgi:hypothetical protein
MRETTEVEDIHAGKPRPPSSERAARDSAPLSRNWSATHTIAKLLSDKFTALLYVSLKEISSQCLACFKPRHHNI